MYRNNLTAWLNGDALVQAVASQNKNTIVVVNSVGPLILEPWIDHPNVTAVVWAGLGGTETGNALVDVIYGAVNPSGRLPYTIAKSLKDYPAQLVLREDGDEILNITYSEGCAFCVSFKLRSQTYGYFVACSSTIAISTRRTSRRDLSLALG
jgi:beta-glucosidase